MGKAVDAMRFLHTADWHIGKKLFGYDLLAEQKDALTQITQIAKAQEVDAIVIAGDLYDRSVPSVDAVQLFNDQLMTLNLQEKFPVLAISGNHDSAGRLEMGSAWFSHTNFHLHTRLAQAFQPIEIADTQFFLLPYFEPIEARLYFQEDGLGTMEQAMARVIAHMQMLFQPEKAHVLVSHFFVTGSLQTDSETKLTVGGLETISASLLAAFDYVALGHLHHPQALQAANARYSGSLLPFSLGERKQQKGVWIVDVTKQQTTFTFFPIQPLRQIVVLEGYFSELTAAAYVASVNTEDYIQISLLDRAVIPNMMHQLRQCFPRIIGVTRKDSQVKGSQTLAKRKPQLLPEALVAQFFQYATEEVLTAQQAQWLKEALTTMRQKERGE